MPIIDPICLIDDHSPTISRGKQPRASGPSLKPQETIMSIRSATLAATFILAALGAAHADSVQPMQAQRIELGEVSGVVYYTVERDGFHVVTTLVKGEAGIPVRAVSVLAPGQSVVLSTGAAAGAVEISRQADSLLVREAAAATN
jgi:hypothetical protein